MQMKIGERFRSQVDETELIVVRALPGEVDLTCGGYPLIPFRSEATPGLTVKEGHDAGTALGKRYTDPSAKLELLVTKAGQGTLALAGEPLQFKESKPLPASD